MPEMILIPKPCHEDWYEMLPDERGRHCTKCAKTVVDFTGWQPAAIVFYLKANAGSCGRFRADQLEVPLPSPEDFVLEITRLPVSFMKRVAAIFLFVFGLMAGTACNPRERTMGEPASINQDTTRSSPDRTSIILGDTTIPVKDLKPAASSRQSRTQIMGEPAVMPEPPTITAGAPVFVQPDTSQKGRSSGHIDSL